MKSLLLILFLFGSVCHAQNWQCLQYGVKHYFTNDNGYLRGIRIDSVRTSGGDFIYYPYHTPRGKYESFGTDSLDSTGGSWLGKRVIEQNDGTFLFDNIWHDTTIIKTQAQLADTWIFYSDTSTRYYKAEVIAIDTITILSSLDSLKKY